MKLNFDYYHNLEKVEFRLCNPDGRELFPLPAENRKLTLRFNDLSEITFDVHSEVTLSDNTSFKLEAYDYVQTKRLIYATDIGWFQITAVDEHDNEITKYKSVTAESYQTILKNKGFISEERVYCFYNPSDPYDDRYDSTDDGSVPSVLGQWSKQLGIKQSLGQGLSEPDEPYEDWTVTYINPSLIYGSEKSLCRTFKEETTYGYDWIVNNVEEAFEVVVIFDFMYKTIHVMTPNEVAQKVNVIYTFNNFMKSVDIKEDSDDIVTVLNCSGDNCDITAVNPTGTNYICDFSYYMDKVNNRWMSKELISKLEEWERACKAYKSTYEGLVSDLRSLYVQKTQCSTELQEMSLSLQDLKTAQHKRSVVGSGTAGNLCGIVTAESVQSGKKSIKSGTAYYSTAFNGDKTVTAYQFSPTYNSETKKWVFSGDFIMSSANAIIANNLSSDNTTGVTYQYFSDVKDGSSYCKLQSATKVDKDGLTNTYYCSGFERYIAYTYPITDAYTGKTTYTDTLQTWINLRERLVNSLNKTKQSLESEIDSVTTRLSAVSNRLNILSFFANTPELLRELNCYWIEGDYTNDNISVLEETTPEEEIDLSNELMDAGYIELSKVCQPHFSFSIESIDATKQYEFREQMRLLELGKIITIEKEEGLWYYPALLEISINLDDSEEFSMTFANAMRLDDWGYTYADLISDASSTSRKVSANWQDILAYSKEREEISSLIKDPLDTTLRASFANMVNQEFTIDNNGILGRKKVSETSDEYEDEQMRLINNLLIFTDDNWETSKTALGKIYYYDEIEKKMISTYGLIAETIVGSLIMGETLKIKNSDSTVTIDANGIAIKNEDSGDDVFKVTKNGELFLKNYMTSDETNSSIEGKLSLYVEKDDNDKIVSMLNASADNILIMSDRLCIVSTYFTLGNDGKITARQGSFDSCTMNSCTINEDCTIKGTLTTDTIWTHDKSKQATGILCFEGHDDSDYTDDIYVSDFASYYLKITDKNNETAKALVEVSDNAGELCSRLYTVKYDNDKNLITSQFELRDATAMLWAETFSIMATTTLEGTLDIKGKLTANNSIEIKQDKAESFIVKHDFSATSGTNAYQQFYNQNTLMGSIYQNYDNNEFCIYSWGCNVSIGSASAYSNYLKGTWYCNGSIINSSDKNVKNSISSFDDRYEVLFDSLIPCIYKYNDGNSGRFHSGYIAQEVNTALEAAGMTRDDFAAVCIEKEKTDDERWGLRYEEFVSLNTWQIQKLKKRVTELESLVADLLKGEK